MTKEEIKELLSILQAYADGKVLQYFSCGEWIDVKDDEDLNFVNHPQKYRIKPTSTYRPFGNAEECWEEMKNHEPFGWARSKVNGDIFSINRLCGYDEGERVMKDMFNNCTFADGKPFGKYE